MFNLCRRKERHALERILIELSIINAQNQQIMTNQKAAADQLVSVAALLASIGVEVTKVGTETTALQAAIAALQAAAGDSVTPELQAAIDLVTSKANSLATQVKAVDDLVPDAAPPADGTGDGTSTGTGTTGTGTAGDGTTGQPASDGGSASTATGAAQ